MKSILISVKPKYVAKILNGTKTIEIRKTMPKCDFPIDVYIYCTKDKETIAINPYGGYATIPNKYKNEYFNGKVVAKFTLNKVEEIKFNNKFNNYYIDRRAKNNVDEIALGTASCLCHKELNDYLKEDIGYAWHISNLVIFDKPKELNEFMSIKQYNKYKKDLNKAYEEDEITLSRLYNGDALDDECANCVELLEMTKWCYGLIKAPQSWCYVEVLL